MLTLILQPAASSLAWLSTASGPALLCLAALERLLFSALAALVA